MSKGWKITLYVILILAIIAVVWLMFGNRNHNVKTQTNTDTETLTGETIDDILNIPEVETDSFEEDVMKDLEGFFGNNNGYEDVQGEFGFTAPESE